MTSRGARDSMGLLPAQPHITSRELASPNGGLEFLIVLVCSLSPSLLKFILRSLSTVNSLPLFSR